MGDIISVFKSAVDVYVRLSWITRPRGLILRQIYSETKETTCHHLRARTHKAWHYVSVFYVEPQPLVDLNDLAARIRDAQPDVQVRSMSQFNL